jgi:predicted TIM-barrel fold metal-dependent hydrolase
MEPPEQIAAGLGWEAPGSPEALADRWVQELDRHRVGRAALIASVSGDESSVAAAVARHPSRFVGFFMLDPTAADAPERARRALAELKLRCICLFPAMQRYSLHEPAVARIAEVAAAHPGTALFVHCGVLSVGVRQKLGLPSRFDVRFGNPLDLHALAGAHPGLPFIIPHFGAGLLREALMAADLCSNIHLDTSSSNRWLAYQPGLTLAAVFRQALEVLGPDRLLFGTDSSFFPRGQTPPSASSRRAEAFGEGGWNRSVYDAQLAALDEARAGADVKERVFSGNFDRLFPPAA